MFSWDLSCMSFENTILVFYWVFWSKKNLLQYLDPNSHRSSECSCPLLLGLVQDSPFTSIGVSNLH